MEFNLLLQKISKHYENKLPFSIFCLPDSDLITSYFQKDKKAYITEDFEEKGIVLAPFDYQKVALCIPANKSEVAETKFTIKEIQYKDVPIFKTEEEHIKYLKLVSSAKESVRSKGNSKIVVTRRKELSLKKFDLSIIIFRLLHLFPGAFRYVWFHPETGLWCGASPEVLIITDGTSFTTMALAGTQKLNNGGVLDWSQKEIMEQQIVTDAIATSLQKVTSVMRISKTFTHKAGSIAHLRTDITGVLKNRKATLSTITATLHPTPAVCGSPQKFAKQFIEINEGYDREFYTGIIGPINQKDGSSKLFVNLRCVKIQEEIAYLYVGGGITIDSIAEDEWQETQNKLQTMLQVLLPFLN